MKLRFSTIALELLALSGLASAHAATADLSFNRDIRPIFSDKCFFCHGTDKAHRDSGRRLDLPDGPDGAYAKKDDVIAIKPGDLENSDAWQRIISKDKDDMMPPPKSHKTLTAAQKDTIKRWIEQGAPYQKHWAFETPVKPAVPSIGNRQSPIPSTLSSTSVCKRKASSAHPKPTARRSSAA
jgi:hypothetical protein